VEAVWELRQILEAMSREYPPVYDTSRRTWKYTPESPNKIIWGKIDCFGQICLDLGEIWVKLNWGKIWQKVIRLWQIWLSLGKIKLLHTQKYSICYGYGSSLSLFDFATFLLQ